MKVSFELIATDKNSSLSTLYINVPTKELNWEYHYHPEVELVCVFSGSGTRHVGYHKSSYDNGDLVLIGSNIPHSGFGLDAIDPHEEIVVQFSERIISFPSEIEEARSIIRLLVLSKYGILFGESVKKEIQPQLILLFKAEHSKRYSMLLTILFVLAETKDFILLNNEIMPYTIMSNYKERLQTIFTFIENNYHKDISIHKVAYMVNLTLPSFCNFFKHATKITFSDFLNKYRIDKACFLLIEGKTISQACYESGYNSLSYFSKTFKRYIGKTPTAFYKDLVK